MCEESIRSALELMGTVSVFDEIENRLVLEAAFSSRGYEVYMNPQNQYAKPEKSSLDAASAQIMLNMGPGRWLWAGEPNGHAYKARSGKYHLTRGCVACPEDANRYSMALRDYTHADLWCRLCAMEVHDNAKRKMRWLTPGSCLTVSGRTLGWMPSPRVPIAAFRE